MTPLDFLAVVLPSPDTGLYCVAELSTRKKEHKFDTDLANLERSIHQWHTAEKDVYFALSTFEIAGSREADNARYIRSFFIDMDGYATKKAAAQALTDFCAKTRLDLLGTPYIVSSGGGLHVYWPLTEDMPIARWKPVAEGLKRLCKQEGLAIDNTVTADAARVLRVPGTTNFKKKYGTPRPVRLLHEGDTFVFEDFESVVVSQLKAPLPVVKTTSLALDGARPTSVNSSSGTLQALTQNSVTKFGNIFKKTKQGTGCAQLIHYVDNASEDGMEPQWRGWLSIAQKCVDGEKAAIWLTDLHPYDHGRMHQKLGEIKGPYPCTKFDSENPGICENCPHWGKITNPLQLGREMAVVATEVEIEVDTGSPSEPPKKMLQPEPPRGYSYGQHGGVFMEKEDTDAQGNVNKRQIMLCQYTIFPVDILNNNGVHEVHFYAIRRNKVQEILLPQKCVASKDETIKHLAVQNVMAAFGSGNDKHFYEYIRACVEKLSVEKEPVVVPSGYGWQPDDSFVFAGKVYSKGREPISVPMPGLENIVNNTQPTGTLENWQKVINMMVRRKLWDHLAILLIGVGAPLMRFTGLFGLTVHCASSESGTGKSFALDAAASVWGHPIHYRTGSGTSAVAMQQRLGLLRNLPLITDEITTNNRKDFEWFPAFLFSMSEGRGKERMESGTNRERLNLSTWAGMSLMSSNRGAVDYLMGERQHSSEGEIRRLLEFIMDEKLEWTPEEIEIIKSLQKNYAVAGEVLAQYFVDNVEYLSTLVPDTVRRMYDVYNAPNDERFWMAGVGCSISAGVLLNGQHTGLVEIPMQEMIEAFRKVLVVLRSSIKSNKRTADDVLNSYIQEHQGKFVVVKYGEKVGVLAHFHDGSMVGKSTTRAEVMGRVEHGVTEGCIDFYIEERLLRSYCSSRSFSYNNFKQQIQESHIVAYMAKKDMMARTEAPPMRVAAIKITKRIHDDEAVFLQPPLPVATS